MIKNYPTIKWCYRQGYRITEDQKLFISGNGRYNDIKRDVYRRRIVRKNKVVAALPISLFDFFVFQNLGVECLNREFTYEPKDGNRLNYTIDNIIEVPITTPVPKEPKLSPPCRSKIHPYFNAIIPNAVAGAKKAYSFYQQGNSYCFIKQSCVNRLGEPIVADDISKRILIAFLLFGKSALTKDYVIIHDDSKDYTKEAFSLLDRETHNKTLKTKQPNYLKKCRRRTYQKHKEKHKAQSLERYYKIKEDPEAYEELKRYHKKYRTKHKAHLNKLSKEHGKANRKQRTKKEMARRKWIKENDPIRYAKFKAARNIRNRITNVIKLKGLKKLKKNGPFEKMVGLSQEDFYQHIEDQFTTGMTWLNYGKWHIDHIKPLDAFGDDIVKPDIVKVINHYTNLQPLWASDNLSKGCIWNE